MEDSSPKKVTYRTPPSPRPRPPVPPALLPGTITRRSSEPPPGVAGAQTGSGGRGLGWFVGHVSRGDREYLFVTSYTDRVPSTDDRPAGWIARDMTKKILTTLGAY